MPPITFQKVLLVTITPTTAPNGPARAVPVVAPAAAAPPCAEAVAA